MEEASRQNPTRGLAACGLTLLVPGAGHLYLGRWKRGLVFFVLIAAVAALGVVEQGNLSVVTENAPFLTRLQVGVNLAMGPAEPLLRKAIYGELIYDPRPSNRPVPDEVERFVARRKERASEATSPYGTAYLWTAGLLNLLLLLDVYDLAVGRKR